MTPASRGPEATVILVGNPNVGKSALFGALTGVYATVSNYPGTTVEVASGTMGVPDGRARVLDTPGVASLRPSSEDERVTRDLLVATPGAVAVLVADAKNLERGLVLLLELGELGLPAALCLNMADEAAGCGIAIDRAHLARLTGVPVAATVAVRRTGLRDLQAAIADARVPTAHASYGPGLEAAAAEAGGGGPAARGLAIAALAESDADVAAHVDVARRRTAAAIAAAVRTHHAGHAAARRVHDTLDRLSTHRIWGWPLLAAVLAATYAVVGVFGAGTLVGWIEDGVFGRFVNPLAVRAAARLPWPWLADLLAGRYGLVTMGLTYALALVLPIVTTFFAVFGALEDSGYLPRVAVVVNRFFRAMGLSGKAVLPMVLGLGCGTMAILTTRVLETRRERMIVILLLSVGVPCSAQLAVVLGLLGPLPLAATAVWLAIVLVTLLLVGRLAAALLPGRASDFVLELPPLRLPRPGNVLAKTLARVEWYVREAVPLFLLGTFLLYAADRVHALAALEALCRPVVEGVLGLPSQSASAFVMGFLRRDFGAAGLFRLAQEGALSPRQTVVAVVTVTLLLPCVAQFFMIVKERGLRTAAAVAACVVPFAVAAGAAVRLLLDRFPGLGR